MTSRLEFTGKLADVKFAKPPASYGYASGASEVGAMVLAFDVEPPKPPRRPYHSAPDTAKRPVPPKKAKKGESEEDFAERVKAVEAAIAYFDRDLARHQQEEINYNAAIDQYRGAIGMFATLAGMSAVLRGQKFRLILVPEEQDMLPTFELALTVQGAIEMPEPQHERAAPEIYRVLDEAAGEGFDEDLDETEDSGDES